MEEKSFEFTLNVRVVPFRSEAYDEAMKLFANGYLTNANMIYIRICEELRLKKAKQ